MALDSSNTAAGRPPAAAGDAPDVPERYRLPRQTPSPLVAAVSPMTDAEVLDASAAVRRQRIETFSLVLDLAFAGQKGKSTIKRDFAKRFEQALQTRGASNAITAYSHGGGLFGFQVGPRLRADATSPETRRKRDVGNFVLERQSFPVLVIVGMDADDLRLRFGRENGRLTAYEPVLVFHQSFRWLPLNGNSSGRHETDRLNDANDLLLAEHRLPETADELRQDHAYWRSAAAAARALSDAPKRTRLTRERLALVIDAAEQMHEEAKRKKKQETYDKPLESLFKSREAFRGPFDENAAMTIPTDSLEVLIRDFKWKADDAARSRDVGHSAIVDSVRQRLTMLRVQAFDTKTEQYIPLELFDPQIDPVKVPAVMTIHPRPGPMEADVAKPTTFVLNGRHLNLCRAVRLGNGREVEFKHVGDSIISVTLDPSALAVKRGDRLPLELVSGTDGVRVAGLVVFNQPPEEK